MSRWADKILGIESKTNNYKNNYTLADGADLEKIILSKNPYEIKVTKDISLTWGGESGTKTTSDFYGAGYVGPNMFRSRFEVYVEELDGMSVSTAIVSIEYASASLAKICLEYPPIGSYSGEYYEIWVGLDGKYISYQYISYQGEQDPADYHVGRPIPKKGCQLVEVFRGTIPTGTNTGTNKSFHD